MASSKVRILFLLLAIACFALVLAQPAHAAMIPPPCTSCHPGYPLSHAPIDPIASAGCQRACHSDDGWVFEYPYYTHHTGGPAANPGCTPDCHGGDGHDLTLLIPRTCESCHNTAWPSVPQHTPAEVAIRHDVPAVTCTASGCHLSNLITEHDGKTPSGGGSFTCLTCHESGNPVVLAAIAAGDTRCVTCHPTSADHYALHDTTVPPSCSGASCHSGTNLQPIHAASTCATCHDSTDPNVVNAIATGNKDCVTCHPTTNHTVLHDTTVPPACAGAGCHSGTNLIPIHSASTCATCHQSTNPLVINAIATHNKTCTACHPHASDEHILVHLTVVPPSCAGTGCHSGDPYGLLTVHPLGVDGKTCDECHASTDPNVVNAIATGNKDCVACHPTTNHTVLHDTTVNPACAGAGCHSGTNLIPIHSASTCATCHGSTDPNVVNAIATHNKDCFACHPTTNHTVLHDTTVPAECAGSGCHSGTNLIPIHGSKTCATCHQSTNPLVINAIATHNKNCVACHPGGADHSALHNGGFTDPKCAECHNQNIAIQHNNNCDLCHDSTDPGVEAAIANGNTECGACHPEAGSHEAAPSNSSQWSATIAGNAAEAPTPHAGYSMTTVKCNVCHAVHRSSVAGMLSRNQVNGDWVTASTAGSPEMLLRSTVSDACSYCHIDTAIGGVRLFNGNSANRTGSAAFTGGWGHETMACAECHATHGAETFRGAATSKILKYTTANFLRDSTVSPTYFPSPRSAIPNIGNNVANHTYNDPITGEGVLSAIQDEIFVEPDGVTVAAGNVPQFHGISDVINGVNPVHDAVGANMKDLQVGAFCTLCHGTYASDSAAVVNLDQDSTLWGGTYLKAGQPTWTLSGINPMAGTFMSKGHPVMKATTNFQASGASAEVAGTQVAWGDANTCRKCHDAGSSDAPDGTVVYSSWPHMTPGYYRFMSAAPDAASYAARNAGSAAANFTAYGTGRTLGMTLPGTGNFLVAGAFITPASGLPLPNAAQVASYYTDQTIKGTAADPNASVTIGRDGTCLKCHKKNASSGIGMTF